MKLKKTHSLETGDRFVSLLRFSPDHRWIVGGGGLVGQPACLLVWDASSLALKGIQEFRKETVAAVALNPTGEILATSCWSDSEVQLWHFPSLKPIYRLSLGPITGPTGTLVASSATTVVRTLAFSPSGDYLAAGSWDLSVRLWQIGPKRSAVQLLRPSHVDNVDYVFFLGRDKALVSGTADTLRIWDASAQKLRKQVILESKQHVWTHRDTPDGKWIISVGDRGEIRRWSFPKMTFETFKITTRCRAVSVSISPDSNEAAIGFDNGRVLIWGIAQGESFAELTAGKSVLSVDYSPSGNSLACVCLMPGQKTELKLYNILR